MCLILDVSAQSPKPVFWATLAFAAGIGFATLSWRPPTWWLGAALVFLVAATYWARGRKTPRVTVLAAFFCLGALAVQLHDTANDAIELGELADGRPVVVTGHVTRDGVLRQGSFGRNEQSLEIDSETIADPGANAQPIAASAGLRLNIYYARDTAGDALSPPALETGKRLRVITKLHAPRNFGNPGAWDYRGYMVRQGIVAIGSAKAQDVELLAGFGGRRVSAWRATLRRSVLAHMKTKRTRLSRRR